MELRILKGVISYDVEAVYYCKSFKAEGTSNIPFGTVDLSYDRASGRCRVSVHPDRHRSFIMHECRLELALTPACVSALTSGFQSWTESKERSFSETESPLRKISGPWARRYHLPYYGDEHFYEYPDRQGRFHSYSYTALRSSEDQLLIAASLDESVGYTIFEVTEGSLSVVRECEGLRVSSDTLLLDFCILQGAEDEVVSTWRESLGRSPQARQISGWSSWYNHFEKITETIVRKNLAAFASRSIPIDYIQIDDGWQRSVGDWLEYSPAFSGGMAALADDIHEAGYQAGLWLAPFVAEADSALCTDHAEWVLKDPEGRPVRAGYNPSGWSGDFYSLDVYHPGFREYLKKVMSTVRDQWGFDLVKLDFLYAAAIIPRDGRSRGMIMHQAMSLLAESCAGMKILGCGVPLGAAAHHIDYCRVSSDVSLGWEDRPLKLIRYRERVSTLNAITSTIARRYIDGLWFRSDPDVSILREENNSLSAAQRSTLFLVNNLFGAVQFTSDDLDLYSEELMSRYLSMFPLIEKQITRLEQHDPLTIVHVRIGEREYLVLINLKGRRAEYTLPGDEGVLYFEAEGAGIHRGGDSMTLEKYRSCVLLESEGSPWQVIGTSERLFPASEIHSLLAVEEPGCPTVNIYPELEQSCAALGEIFLAVPGGREERIEQIFLHGQPLRVYQEHGLLIARGPLKELS